MQVVFQDVTEERQQRELLEAFASHVVRGHEEERQRISQELHDGPLQNVIHLCRQIDSLEEKSGVSEETRGVRTNLESLVREIRGIARGLRPPGLDDLGLVASIGQLLAETESQGQVRTSFGITGRERRLPQAVELALFRIVQEALSNVERHAEASTVAVGLDFEQEGLRLLVKDDGVGFDPTGGRDAPRGYRLGVAGMTERAGLIGATLRVRSNPGAGTSIDVCIPSAIFT